MNGKAAKKLRRLALELSAVIEENGTKIAKRQTDTDFKGSVVNIEASHRRIYQDLKNGIKKSRV